MFDCPNPADPPKREKIPLEGVGPSGWPSTYYTSRVLNSTIAYDHFVKKLRKNEERERVYAAIDAVHEKDEAYASFTKKSERKSHINNVAQKVELCLRAYKQDLNDKRVRLKKLLEKEEEENLGKIVAQVQRGEEEKFQRTKDRLAFLKAKRQKEHEELYKEPPISKCQDAYPLIVKMRERQTKEMQHYQICEKQAIKRQEKENDKIWLGVFKKEYDAMTARMESDLAKIHAGNTSCYAIIDKQVEMKKQRMQEEKKKAMEEAKIMQTMFEEQRKSDEEAEKQRLQRKVQMNETMLEAVQEQRKEGKALRDEEQAIDDAFYLLACKEIAKFGKEKEIVKRRAVENVICNKHLVELKKWNEQGGTDDLVDKVAREIQMEADRKRCIFEKWRKKLTEDARKGIVHQIEENKKKREMQGAEKKYEIEYANMRHKQLKDLVAYKEQQDAEARKRYQQHLKGQIEYNASLKEKERQEELEQIKKCKEEDEDYKKQIQSYLNRTQYSPEVHPFTSVIMKKDPTGKMPNPCLDIDLNCEHVRGHNMR